MTKELKMVVGVALLAALALAGALGIFTFSAAQPVRPRQLSADRSFRSSASSGGAGRNRDGDHRLWMNSADFGLGKCCHGDAAC